MMWIMSEPLHFNPHYLDALLPLAEFCALQGYRWRWKIQKGEQWHATVQILDPRHSDQRDKVRAWYGSTSIDEMTALRSAVKYAVDGAQQRLDADRGKLGGSRVAPI